MLSEYLNPLESSISGPRCSTGPVDDHLLNSLSELNLLVNWSLKRLASYLVTLQSCVCVPSRALWGSCSPPSVCIHRIQLIPLTEASSLSLSLPLPGNVITDNVLLPVGVSHGRVISSGTDIISETNSPNIVPTLQSISASQSHLCHFNFVSADSAARGTRGVCFQLVLNSRISNPYWPAVLKA